MTDKDEARRALTVDQAAFELPGVRMAVNRLLNSPGGRDLARYIAGRLRAGQPWTTEDTRNVLQLAGEDATVARAASSVLHLRALASVERDREAISAVRVRLETIDAVGFVVIARLKRERIR